MERKPVKTIEELMEDAKIRQKPKLQAVPNIAKQDATKSISKEMSIPKTPIPEDAPNTILHEVPEVQDELVLPKKRGPKPKAKVTTEDVPVKTRGRKKSEKPIKEKVAKTTTAKTTKSSQAGQTKSSIGHQAEKKNQGHQAEKPVSENIEKGAPEQKTEIREVHYKALYVKMILQDIPDNTLISGDITIKQIIYSILGGQKLADD